MGIPYSKQINAAFNQVTPLVASAYEVLETTKDIALIILGIQVLMIILLSSILLALVGLLFTLNPDLEKERKQLVTPVMQWIASWTLDAAGNKKSIFGSLLALSTLVGVGVWFWLYHQRQATKEYIDQEQEAEEKGDQTKVSTGEPPKDDEVK